ncbi:MAG: ABC transporter ATP-binding protein, partial [Planctomycetia bacterium]|nr:ABC transporter ATP-binding protein [Planctomycetia bacterium]
SAQEGERAARTPTTAAPARPAPPTRTRLSYKEQRELDGMEAAIEAAERAHTAAEARVSDPAIAADHQKMAAACADLDRAQAAVAALYARWQELESKRAPTAP